MDLFRFPPVDVLKSTLLLLPDFLLLSVFVRPVPPNCFSQIIFRSQLLMLSWNRGDELDQ